MRQDAKKVANHIPAAALKKQSRRDAAPTKPFYPEALFLNQRNMRNLRI